jgi:hypothetical protein
LLCATFAVLSAATVHADPFAYLASGDSSFGVINLQTGLYTPLGETSVGDSEKVLYGMGVANGLLFATTWETDAGALFTVNPTNGDLTFVGNANGNDPQNPAAAETPEINFWALGSTNSGLYGIDAASKDLYSVNPNNGAATLIGNTGLLGFGDWSQLSVGSNNLYFANGDTLYSVNTTTGAATLIGETGGRHIGAMVYENGVLYGGENPSYFDCNGPCGLPCQQNCEIPPCDEQNCGDGGLGAAEPVPGLNVVILSTETGNATLQAAVSGLADDDSFFALAPAAALATPEPSTGLLAGISAAALLFALRRKMRAQSV